LPHSHSPSTSPQACRRLEAWHVISEPHSSWIVAWSTPASFNSFCTAASTPRLVSAEARMWTLAEWSRTSGSSNAVGAPGRPADSRALAQGRQVDFSRGPSRRMCALLEQPDGARQMKRATARRPPHQPLPASTESRSRPRAPRARRACP
jgi:hypothetical protein